MVSCSESYLTCRLLAINHNGPAIWGGCVTRRKHRAGSWYFRCVTIPVQGGYGTCFCSPGTNFTQVLARSRYKFDRSHEFIPGYKVGCGHWRRVEVQFVSEQEICQGLLSLNWGQMSESGCKNHYKFVLSAGAKAKTVTNNLPILSVLGFRCNIIFNAL
jgi:hypothetical protein